MNTYFFVNLKPNELENYEWVTTFVNTSSFILQKTEGNPLEKTPWNPKNEYTFQLKNVQSMGKTTCYCTLLVKNHEPVAYTLK